MSNKPSEAFFNGLGKGHTLIKNGTGTVNPDPIQCIPTSVRMDFSRMPLNQSDDFENTMYLTYSKNGGEKVVTNAIGLTGDYDLAGALAVRNSDNTSVAFSMDASFDLDLPPVFTIQGIGVDYDIENEQIVFPVINDNGGGLIAYYGMTVNSWDTVSPEVTVLTFYRTAGAPPSNDLFYSMVEDDTTMSVSVIACASVKIDNPYDNGPTTPSKVLEYDDSSNVTVFTTSNETDTGGELPFKLELQVEMESYEVRDGDTNELLASQAGVGLVSGVTVNNGVISFQRTSGPSIRRFRVSGNLMSLRIMYGEQVDDGRPIPGSDDGLIIVSPSPAEPPQLSVNSPGSFTIEKMSTLVDQYIFNTGDADLTVPDKIPSTLNTFNDMFKNALRFNQDLSGWLTTNVNWMINMFQGAISFNGDVTNWDVSNVEGMWNMFKDCAKFNQDISQWDTSSCNDMDHMFDGCTLFNQPIGGWETGLVEYCSAMFRNCKNFNQSLYNWNLSSCEYFDEMFSGTPLFNQDISAWDVGTGSEMVGMFKNAFVFNQDLSSWCVELINERPDEFDDGALVWSKPRPVWGTCASGGVVVPPPVDGSTLKFTMNANDDYSGGKPFTIRLKNPEMGWEILAGNVTIASSSFLDPSVTKKTETWDGNVTVLTIAHPRGTFSEYTVKAVADYVKLSTTFEIGGTVSKYVEILHFSSTIKNHRFNLPSTELIAVPETLPTFITNLDYMFTGCAYFNQDLSGWDVSNIVSMSGTFSGCINFNGNISNWDVSNVTSFTGMLQECENFTRDITNWVVSSGTDFSSMFSGALSFNQNISRWNMSQATDISSMFEGCVLFNQDISMWDVRNVRRISYLFSGCAVFNQNVNGWQLSGIDSMYSVFQGCSEYNQPLDNWDMSLVAGASQMLKGCAKFNQDIGGWNFSSLVSATGLLEGCTVFNQDISGWTMGNVSDTEAFFKGCAAFNQDISGWDMGSARSLQDFFNGALSFNQDISGWDVSKVEYFSGSFVDAASFNQDLSWWCVSQERFGPSVPYDKGAVSWGLPHISWGNCVRGEDVGTSDSYVKPPQPTNGLIWTQAFNNQQLEIRIKVTGLVGEWALWHGRFILVSSTKTDNYITVYETDDKTSVEIQIDRGKLRTLQFVGVADEVRFEVYDPDETDVALGYFDVLQFSETVTNHKFNLPDLDLTLPDTPPPIAPTNMYRMFKGSNRFNQDLSAWDVSQVTTMRDAFKGCSTFNSDLSGWVTTAVKSMIGMFSGCKVFNQDLSGWCVSNYDFEPPAFTTDCFNWVLPKPIWGTCSGTSNQPEVVDLNSDKIVFEVSLEDVRYMNTEVRLSISNVLPGWKLVDSATGTVLCQPLGTSDNTTDVNPAVAKSAYWLKSAGSHMDSMRVDIVISSLEPKRYELHGTGTHLDVSNSSQLFDPHPAIGLLNIKQWSTNVAQYSFGVGNFDLIVPPKLPPHITSMEGMFRYSNQFNQDLDTWDTSNITNMAECFLKAYKFNGRIGTWDVSNVTNMTDFMSAYDKFHNQFSGDFNQDVSKWDVSNVTDMTRMFARHTNFNQDLTTWCVTHIASKPSEFVSYGFDVANLPVWGTCPVTLTGSMSDTRFTIDNTVLEGQTLFVKVTAGNVSEDYKFLRNGVQVVGYYGATDPSITEFTRTTRAIFFTVKINPGEVDSFVLNTGAESKVSISWVSGASGAERKGLVDVTQFSESATGYSFPVRWLDIKVPSVLPRSITDCSGMFFTCYVFNQDISMWDVSNVTDMSSMFYVCYEFDQDLSGWDVSQVTNFSGTFESAGKFNHDIGMWDVSSAVRMYGMFSNADAFNQDISGWDVSNVETMEEMFESTDSFNQDISGWDVSGILSDGHMTAMFKYARAFNQDLSWWCVTNAPYEPYEFDFGATAWELPRPVWGTCPVDIRGLESNTEFTVDNTIVAGNPIELVVEFELVNDDVFIMRDGNIIADATGSKSPEVVITYMQFNQYKTVLTVPADKISHYIINPGAVGNVTINHTQTVGDVNATIDVTQFSSIADQYSLKVGRLGLTVPSTLPRNIEFCSEMFYNCIHFNQDLSGWDMSNVRGVKNMFTNCKAFNQPVGGWKFSPDTRDLRGIFKGCSAFNQDLSEWDVSQITYLSSLFEGASSFNGDISGWDVSSCYIFSDMFKGATSFNQDIGNWDMSAVEHYNGLANMFNGATSFNQDLSWWCMTKAAQAPVGFDTGATAWSLPRPIWGTCPIREDSTDPNELPGVAFIFSLKGEGYVDLYVASFTSSWELYRDDSVIAASDGTTVIGSGVTTSGNELLQIRINKEGSETATYALTGTADSIFLEETSESFDKVTILDMSKNFGTVGFMTYTTLLDVPKYLPPHLTNLEMMFEDCFSLVADLSTWNTSNVTNMNAMFSNCEMFNSDISGWDVSNVTNMDEMFSTATAFNQDLSSWDVSNVAVAPPYKFDDNAVSWTLPRPVWGGGSAISSELFQQIDISGASGTYLTVSKNNGPYVTYNLADPSFNEVEFTAFIGMTEDQGGLAFIKWPLTESYTDEQIGPDKTPGIAGFNLDGNIVTPNHPDGFDLTEPLWVGTYTVSPPFYKGEVETVLTIKQTDAAPDGSDIFFTLPGAVEGGTLTVKSQMVIWLA